MFHQKIFGKIFNYNFMSLVLFTLVALIFSSVHGAGQINKAPLNSGFITYTQRLMAPGQIRLGLRPLPINLSQINDSPDNPDVQEVTSYPAVFDLRITGKVTPVGNQGTGGSDWAFATYGSLESNLLPGETRDFSENHLKNTNGFDWGSGSTGNALMATAYLSRWSGPINETDDPFVDSSLVSPLGIPIQKHIQEVHILPDRDRNKIKEYLQKYGAVYTTFYWEDNFFNDTFDAYYDKWPTEWRDFGNNRAVTIVGWDDNYSRNKFLYNNTLPPGNGAYIVKNSKGTNWGDQGYFYVSYYDNNFARDNFAFINADPATNFQRVYQYDPLGWTSSIGVENTSTPTTAWMANIFTPAANEQLVAASWYTVAPNTYYELRIYTDMANANLPTSGTLAATKSGTISMPGYHTIPFTSPVQLTAGLKFAVVVKLNSPNNPEPIAIEEAIAGYSSKATANPGESFLSPNGTDWTDLKDYSAVNNGNICLKAFTAMPLAIIDQPVNQGVKDGCKATFKVMASGTPPLIYQWKFTDQNIPGATTPTLIINNVHQANAGSYTVTVADRTGSMTSDPATLTVLYPPTITQQPASQTVEMGTLANFSVTATGTPPFTYQWKFNGTNISGETAATLEIADVQTANAGSYTVAVTNGQGKATSSVAILTVKKRVETPTFEPDGRIFTSARYVIIRCATPEVIIYYTTDGSDPDTNDPVVNSTGLVFISKTMTLKALAWKNGWLSSHVKNAVYTVTGTVATPTFSLKSGAYTSAQTVTIGCTTPKAVIRYTTDGSEPTPVNGTVYHSGDGIDFTEVDSPTKLKAKAWKDGWDLSATATAVYTITGTLPTPVFNPDQDDLSLNGNEVPVTVSCSIPGATIHYTTDDTEPVSTSPMVSGGEVVVNRTMTLKAKAFKKKWISSTIKSANYNITQVATPVFSLAEGVYSSPKTVQMGCATLGAVIRYELSQPGDGPKVPDENSKVYTPGSPINIPRSAILTAKAFKTGMSDSNPVSAEYTITDTVTTPSFDPPPGSFNGSVSVQINCFAPEDATIRYTTDGTDPAESTGTAYNGETLVFTTPTLLKAKAWSPGLNPSAVGSALYTCHLPELTYSPDQPTGNPTNTYTSEQLVKIECSVPEATIRYTTNGTEPTSASPVADSEGVVVNYTSTLKAKAWKTNWLPSPTKGVTYTINKIIKPVFSVPEGSYPSPITVKITCATPGAVIRYTLSDPATGPPEIPTNQSTVYTPGSLIAINKNIILTANAWKSPLGVSEHVSTEYKITGKVKTPTFSLPSGKYPHTKSVTITCTTPGATIRYTTDGSEPTVDHGSIIFGAGAITVASSFTLKARAFYNDWLPSAMATAVYTLPLPALYFDISAGPYTTEQQVTISCPIPEATIHYTTNGTEPTTSSPVITSGGKVLINKTLTLKAKAWKKGWLPSPIQSAVYTFTGVATPIFSVAEGTYSSPQKITIKCPTKGATIRYTDTGMDLAAPGSGFLYIPGTVIPVASTKTLKAKAYVPGTTKGSEVKSATYTIINKVAKPVLSLSPGQYPVARSVTISCETQDAVIHYTTNGNEPAESDPVIASGGSLPVEYTMTLKAKAWKNDINWDSSNIASASYTILQVSTPSFTPDEGESAPNGLITVSCATPDVVIRYTINGNDPTLSDPVVASGSTINIGETNVTLKARAWKTGLVTSEIKSADYIIVAP
jgi:C1A family cysteine protease